MRTSVIISSTFFLFITPHFSCKLRRFYGTVTTGAFWLFHSRFVQYRLERLSYELLTRNLLCSSTSLLLPLISSHPIHPESSACWGAHALYIPLPPSPTDVMQRAEWEAVEGSGGGQYKLFFIMSSTTTVPESCHAESGSKIEACAANISWWGSLLKSVKVGHYIPVLRWLFAW